MMNKRRKYTDLFVCLLVGSVLWCGCGVEDKAISMPLIGSEALALAETDDDSLSEKQEEGQKDSEAAGKEYDSDAQEQLLYVHVCGAVQNPGVVVLPQGSRREDALLAAGGFSEDACETYVNLAALLVDGEQLYFPNKEEGNALRKEETQAAVTLVNINTAGEELLCTLPGIGSERAKEIIAYRQEHGDFLQKEDIMQVSGIKESIYNKICDKIVLK